MILFRVLRLVATHPLNQKDRLAAIGRFFRWQIASRLVNAAVALPFVGSTRLLTRRSMTGATGNYYCGLLEEAEMGFVLHCLRPDDLFVDVGANVGAYTVLAAGAVGANTVSVEPVPSTFAGLLDNIRLNNIAHLTQTYCGGLSNAPGELRFTSANDTLNRVALPGDESPSITVPVTTLDALCGNRRPQIVKIDVEGHEMAVLNGAVQVLSSPEVLAVLMETNGAGAQYGVSDDALLERMREFGLEPFSYDPVKRVLTPASGNAALNTIFVRDRETVAARCASAPRFSLVNGTI